MYTSDVDELELGSPAEIAVLSALNERLDAIDVSGCDAIFDMLDANGNGRLSFEELRLGGYTISEMRGCGVQQDELVAAGFKPTSDLVKAVDQEIKAIEQEIKAVRIKEAKATVAAAGPSDAGAATAEPPMASAPAAIEVPQASSPPAAKPPQVSAPAAEPVEVSDSAAEPPAASVPPPEPPEVSAPAEPEASTSEEVAALRERLAEGHMLTASELEVLERASAE